MDLSLIEHCKAVVEGFERRGFKFELQGGNLGIEPPAGFGPLSGEDRDWFKRRKREVVLYLQNREWRRLTEPQRVNGPATCPVEDCPDRFHLFEGGEGRCEPGMCDIAFVEPGLNEWLDGMAQYDDQQKGVA
jgi:hypothetical protein